MPTLAITIHGPFAYVDDYENDEIILMAPMCPQHNGAMFSSDNETRLDGNKGKSRQPGAHIYKPHIGLTGSRTSFNWYGQGQALRGPILTTFDPRDWRFWVVLPRPYACATLNPVPVFVNGSSKEVLLTVGVRFLYTSWDGQPVTLRETNFRFPEATLTQYGDLQIELSGPVRDDPDHEDAIDCFSYLADGLGFDWSVEFEPTVSGKGSHGNDCHAPVVWVVPLEGTSPSPRFIDYDDSGRKHGSGRIRTSRRSHAK